MKIKVIMAFFVIAISGCQPFDIDESESTKDATIDLKRFVDKDNGVMCYENLSSKALSCVAIKGNKVNK